MARKINKRFWFSVHGWLALPIWGLLAFICLTGTLCTVTPELTWVFSPKVRALNATDAPPLSWGALTGHVQDSYPGAELRTLSRNSSYLAYQVGIQLQDGNRKQLYVNQYTGVVQGERRGSGFRRFMLALHGWLQFPWQGNYNIGWYLVTLMSIPLLGSLITGMIIFKRFWRVLYRPQLRWKKGRRVFWGDLHRLLGAWSIPFMTILSASGMWFIVQGALYQNDVPIYPEAPVLASSSVPDTVHGQAPPLISIDDAVSKALAQYPDLNVSSIKWPDSAQAPFMVRGTRHLSLLRDAAHVVYVNPYTGDVVQAHSGADLSFLPLVSAVLVSLHFGNFAGLASKLIWFFFGCLLSGLVCSGFITWTKRALAAQPRRNATTQGTALMPGGAVCRSDGSAGRRMEEADSKALNNGRNYRL